LPTTDALDLSDAPGAALLTLGLAFTVTAILAVLATPLAWWLARSRAGWKEAVGAVVALPLVLPPTVLGFYLLIALGPSGPGGALASLWGGRTLAFSFAGLVIGSLIYSLPFMVQPLRLGFEAIPAAVLEAAEMLGASRTRRFFALGLPNASRAYLGGIVLTFAHTVGEFGLVLMIGGNVPGRTKVLSIAIFDAVERLQWPAAHVMSAGLVIFGLAVVAAVTIVDRRVVRTPFR
jgi:molybdate transport system permease protein